MLGVRDRADTTGRPIIVGRNRLVTVLRRFALSARSPWPFAVFLLATLGFSAAHAAPTVAGVRMGDQNGATRLVLDVSENIKYSVSVIDDPYRDRKSHV